MAQKKSKYEEEFGTAAGNGNLTTIQRMLTSENPVPVDCLSCILRNNELGFDYMVTALVRACHGGHLAVVQELIRAGADVNWKNDNDPITFGIPLHAACDNGKSPEVVEALLAAGADVNATIFYHRTPLMLLVKSNPPITS